MAKRKKSRKAASHSKPRKRSTHRVGALPKSSKMKRLKGLGSGLMKDLIEPVPVGLGVYGAKYADTVIPLDEQWQKSLILYGGGVLLKKAKLGGLALGVAAQGVSSLIESFLPIPGQGTRGIAGLTPEEVEMIERTAMSDRVNGIVDETVVGGPYRQASEVW